MPTAEELFTETFRRFNNNWNVINSIRQFLAVTGSIAPVAMQEYHAGQMEMLSANHDFRKIFGEVDKPLNPELMNLLQSQVTQRVGSDRCGPEQQCRPLNIYVGHRTSIMATG